MNGKRKGRNSFGNVPLLTGSRQFLGQRMEHEYHCRWFYRQQDIQNSYFVLVLILPEGFGFWTDTTSSREIKVAAKSGQRSI